VEVEVQELWWEGRDLHVKTVDGKHTIYKGAHVSAIRASHPDIVVEQEFTFTATPVKNRSSGRCGFKGFWPDLVKRINGLSSTDFIVANKLNSAEYNYCNDLAILGYLRKEYAFPHNASRQGKGLKYYKIASVPETMTTTELRKTARREERGERYDFDRI
jgi:hypothetical protein